MPADGDGARTRTTLKSGVAALAIQNIAKSFGGLKVLEDVSMSVAAGEIHGLIGPNGAGKTTLFNIIAGVMRPDAGSVRLYGDRLHHMPVYKRCRAGVARTFQTPRPFRQLSVYENVLVAAKGGGGGRTSAARVAKEALERAGMVHLAASSAATLSLGHLKLLELARALATGPRMLLLDEIMAGLNAEDVVEISGRLQSLQADGISILLVDHVLTAVMRISNQVSVLNGGRILITDSPRKVAADEAVIEAYLGQVAHVA